jgi:hypothetical protein
MTRLKTAITVAAACIVGSVAGLGQTSPSPHQSTAKADRWESWRPLVGIWEGESQGKPGKGSVMLEVSFVLNNRFLKLATTADYRDEKGGSEHHEDFGFVSFDRGRSKFVFRQFHAEGFVNHYTLTSEPKADLKIELTSESCENTPTGWKARETYRISGDALHHTFDLAPPDRPFERYITATLKRRKK